MNKADVLAKLDKFKGQPVEIGVQDEGIIIHANIDGHWLFVEGDNLVEVKVNSSDGTYGFSSAIQQQNPFKITYFPFEDVYYVRSYIANDPGDIADKLSGLEPVGTDKSFDDIIKEIEGNDIRKALSPRGNLNVSDVAPGGPYGTFKGSAVSTSRDGIPQYMKDALLKKTENVQEDTQEDTQTDP